MHRAAEAFVEAGFLGENFRQGTVDQEVDGQVADRFALALVGLFDDLPGCAAEEILHDRPAGRLRSACGSRTGPWPGFRRGCGGTEDEIFVVSR